MTSPRASGYGCRMRSRVALLAAISAICLLGGLGAFEPSPAVNSVGVTSTPDELARAEEVLRESGLVEGVTGRSDWHFVRPLTVGSHDGPAVVSGVNFPEPVDAAGNWFILKCGSTQVWESVSAWTDVHTIHVTIGLESREVLSFGVGVSYSEVDRELTHAPTLVQAPEMIRIRDARSGQYIRLVQADLARCPGLPNGN